MKKHIYKILLLVVSLGIFCNVQKSQAAIFFSDSFESGDLTHIEGGAFWGSSGCGGTGTCHDGSGSELYVSTDRAHAGTSSLKFVFGGNLDDQADSSSEQRFNLGGYYDEIYIQWYEYFPDGTGLEPRYVTRYPTGEDRVNNNKFIILWKDSYTSGCLQGFELQGNTGGIYASASTKTLISGYPSEPTCTGLYGFVSGADSWTMTDGDLGRWIRFEMHGKWDPGIGDNEHASLELFVDGIRYGKSVFDYVDAPCSTDGICQFHLGYLMGWANSGFDVDTTVYIDDVKFSTTYIGTSSDIIAPASPSGLSVS